LESGFLETTFRKTNTTKKKNIFLETKPKFSLTGKCFSLINFFNDKQIQKNLKNNFLKITSRKQYKLKKIEGVREKLNGFGVKYGSPGDSVLQMGQTSLVKVFVLNHIHLDG